MTGWKAIERFEDLFVCASELVPYLFSMVDGGRDCQISLYFVDKYCNACGIFFAVFCSSTVNFSINARLSIMIGGN